MSAPEPKPEGAYVWEPHHPLPPVADKVNLAKIISALVEPISPHQIRQHPLTATRPGRCYVFDVPAALEYFRARQEQAGWRRTAAWSRASGDAA